MKTNSIAFTLTVLLSQMSLGQINESQQLQNELTAQGVHLVGLMNTTQNELIQTMDRVGGAKVLFETATSSKIEYRAHFVLTNSSFPKVTVDFKNGDAELSQESAQEVFDAAISYFSQHPDPSLRRKTTSRLFDAAIKCIEFSGQGQDQVIWCGFFDGFIN